MTIRYAVTRWESPHSMRAMAHHTVSRCDAAADRLWAEIYAMAESQALLDRPAAWRLLREFPSCEIAPPAPGHYRSQRFELNGAYVEFRADRVERVACGACVPIVSDRSARFLERAIC